MREPKTLFIVFLVLITNSCFSQLLDQYYLLQGRVEKMSNDAVVLVGTAASISFNFTGNQCAITLQSVDSWEHHNYVSLVLDGIYIGKRRIEKGAAQIFDIPINSERKVHNLQIYKSTEAHSGGILFAGTSAKLYTIKSSKAKKIEFIGDSITCGAASDATTVPCDQGAYFDHHNGYFAYGPVVARALEVNYLMSCVSGIGIYRNWNDENGIEPIMPEVYQNLYLTKEEKRPKYDFAFQPDIISIALGTNDFSTGDGKKRRKPFDAQQYISNYVDFIKMLFKHHPKAEIVITNSPMVTGESAIIFDKCLEEIKAKINKDHNHLPILIFKFKPMTATGCSGHPNLDEHQVLAQEYLPFLKQLLHEK